MSLINQMLKDLAARPKHSLNPEIILSGLQSYPARTLKQVSRRSLFIAACMVVLSGSLSVYFYLHTRNQSNILYRPNNVFHAIEKPVHMFKEQSAALPVLSHPAILTAITYQIQQGVTSLRFLLTQNSFYRVESDNGLNRLVIILENTQMTAAPPILNYQNSALTGMTLENMANGDLKMTLSLRQNIEIKHIELNEIGKLPELQLELFSSEINSNIPLAVEKLPESAKRLTSNLDDQYQAALAASKKGDYELAIKQLSTLLEQSPTFVRGRESLVTLLLQQGNQQQAEQVLKKGIQLLPTHIPYIELSAQLLIQQKKMNEAYNLLKKTSPSINIYPDYYALIAAIYQYQGKSVLALGLYHQLLAIKPDQSKWWIGLGLALESLGKTSEALEAYEESIKNKKNLTPDLLAYAQERIENL